MKVHRSPNQMRKKKKMAQKKSEQNYQCRLPETSQRRSSRLRFLMVVLQDPQLSERTIDAARDRAGFDDPSVFPQDWREFPVSIFFGKLTQNTASGVSADSLLGRLRTL